jgi:hypothetical protein
MVTRNKEECVMQHVRAITAAAEGSGANIPTLLDQFHERIRGAPFHGRVTADSPSHPQDMPNLVFTFTDGEAARRLQDDATDFIVHHGRKLCLPGATMRLLITEHLMPFASASLGQLCLSRMQLGQILAGAITRWEALAAGTGVIRLLAHGGEINHALFKLLVAQNFGSPPLAPIELLPSYADLADAARRCGRCLVFGLRPTHMRSAETLPVILGGTKPWATQGPSPFPALPIHIGWRESAEDAPGARYRVADYLDLVAARMEADALALATISARETARAA